MLHKPSGLTKVQLKLLEMEMEALNRGLSRTQLTVERATVAVSAMLTKQVSSLAGVGVTLIQYSKIMFSLISNIIKNCYFLGSRGSECVK